MKRYDYSNIQFSAALLAIEQRMKEPLDHEVDIELLTSRAHSRKQFDEIKIGGD